METVSVEFNDCTLKAVENDEMRFRWSRSEDKRFIGSRKAVKSNY
jgi:hypothetical protein